MAEKTSEQIIERSKAAINALGTYLDYESPPDQQYTNGLGRIGNIQPIQTQEDLTERGFIGGDGLLTPKGELFKTLNENGFLNSDGTFPEKSAALLMDEDTANLPENLNAWRIRKANKVGETSSTWSEAFGSMGEKLYDAGAGLATMVKLGLQNIDGTSPDVIINDMKAMGVVMDEDKVRESLQKENDKLLNKSSIAATSFVENSIKAFSEAGALIDLGGAWALSLPSKMIGDHKNATELFDTARQFQDRVIKSNKDAVIGSTLDALITTTNALADVNEFYPMVRKKGFESDRRFQESAPYVTTYVDEMARVKAEMPKAEFDKTIKQTGAAGEIFADPFEMAQVGAILKMISLPVVSRLTLNAERTLGKLTERASRMAQIDVDLADVERAKGMAQNAAELAKRTADAARERFDLNGDQNLLRRANAAEDIANNSAAQFARFTADGMRLSDEAAQIAADAQKLSTRIPVAAAQTFEAAAKAGRVAKALPFKTFAAMVEPVGRGLVALDDGLDSVSKRLGIGAAYNVLTSKVGQTIGYGAALGLGPVPAIASAVGTVLKSGPFLQRMADTSRILGTEMAKAQSQIPFFQRVANNSTISPAHRSLAHLADMATLGGFLPDIARRTVKGTALSFPIDFAAQYMSDGMEINQNTFKQALAESVLIGGSSAALGGMFAGTRQRHRELAVGDEINFRNEITAPDQKQLFAQAPSGIRRAIGTFSAVFPSVNIELTQGGGGFHDDNVVGVDLNSSNPLKYLLAHEIKHLLVHRNQMHMPIVAMMLGDGETGGLMRSPDGTLNPEFEAFGKEYNTRQIASGRQPVSLGKLAEEFFVEAGVNDMERIAESGELGAIASRTEASRMIGRLFNGIFDKSTVLKDFHLRIGGLMDQGGKLVMGNGLLDSGITQTQEMRNMTKNMLSRAAGRSVGLFEPMGAANVGNKGEGPGIDLPITPGDRAMIEKIGPVEFEMETVNGNRQVVRDSNGDPVPIDFNTQLMRSRTGSLVQEAIGNRPSNYQSSPGEMRLNDEGIWEGYLPPDVIEFIKRKGALNQEQIRMVEHVNGMIKNFKGDVALVINHPATRRNKKGKLNYATLKATLRQVAPISWSITKDGNLTLGLMSVTQLKSNIDARISSKMGQKLYQGNRAKLMIDVGKVMELHQKGKRTDAYFDEQYGAAKSQQYKNFVNSVFGLITKKQGEANPIFSEENLRGNGVYKTYRADRISQATKMTGDKYPFQYDFVVQNMMPNGLPTLDAQSVPVAQNRLPEPSDESSQSSMQYMPEVPSEPVKKPKKEKERQVIGDDRVIDKGDKDTLDIIQAANKKGEPSWKDDKPVPISVGYNLATAPHINKFAGKVEDPSTAFLDNLPYDINGAEKQRILELIQNGVVDTLANDMANKTKIVLQDPAIAAGKGWYSRMRVKLLKALKTSGRELFSQLLGATSAQTPVDENFLQTVDAHEGIMSGRYNRHQKGYLLAVKAESEGKLNDEITNSRCIEKIEGILVDLKDELPKAKQKADRIAIYAEIKSLETLLKEPVADRTSSQRLKIYIIGNDLLPRRSNGAKFNANSGAVLKVIAGVWLNNRKSPKTPNFAGNLSGRTVQATIDIWAARYIRRQIYDGQGVPWRIQPKAEVGVSNEDFAFAQIVMERAAKKLGMNPDDLQAILWFAEKDVWDKKGWTKNEGAKKSSFDDIFDIFFPAGGTPLSFAEGSAKIKAAKEQQNAVVKAQKTAMMKSEAAALGVSVAALTRMKKDEK